LITLTVKYSCKPGQTEAVLDGLRRMSALVKEHEPGCTAYQISRSTETPELLFLYELYVDQAALDVHAQTDHFKRIIQGEVIPLLESRVRETFTLEIE
jgi:quinol monooxygenase YgiN